MNPRPKFCVGEEVIIQGEDVTEFNGQIHEVLEVRWSENPRDIFTNEMHRPIYLYLTTSDSIPWIDSSLRKLPPKADPWEDCIFQPLKLTV